MDYLFIPVILGCAVIFALFVAGRIAVISLLIDYYTNNSEEEVY